MSTTDRTYTTKYNILKGRRLSAFHSQNPTKQIEGPRGVTPSSTLTQLKYPQGDICCLSPPICNPGNLVINGDFANGVPDTDYVIPPGWQLLEGDGNNQITSAPSPAPPPPLPAGTRAFRAGNLYNKSYLTQRIRTVVGIPYTLSYYLFNAGSLNSGNWNSSQNLIYFSASVSENNTPIGPIVSISYPATDNGFGWRNVTSRFIAKEKLTLLTFTIMQPPNFFYLTGITVRCDV